MFTFVPFQKHDKTGGCQRTHSTTQKRSTIYTVEEPTDKRTPLIKRDIVTVNSYGTCSNGHVHIDCSLSLSLCTRTRYTEAVHHACDDRTPPRYSPHKRRTQNTIESPV